MHVRDPGLADLRKATRTAVVLPIAFAFGLAVVDDDSFALFAGFAAFAALSFADFGGPLRRRARAYVVFAVIGAGIVVIGTAVSENLAAALLGSLVVVGLIQYVAVFGGYWAAATAPATLAFVLAAMVPGRFANAWPQAGGWLAAGLLAAAGAVVLWPLHERAAIRRRAAATCEAVASLVEAWDAGRPRAELEAAVADVAAATDELTASWVGNRLRPAGPARRDQALAYLIDELRQLGQVTPALPGTSALEDAAPADRALLAAAAPTLRATAELLRSGVDRLHLHELDTFRRADLHDVERRAEVPGPPAEVLAAVEGSFALRTLTHLSLSVAANARIVGGGDVDPEDFFPPAAVPVGASRASTWRRAGRLLASHLTWRSAWLRNALRATVAISVAVAVARVIEVEHGFWVALGTLSVLRSNAVGTARDAVQAIGGTLVGFAVTIPVMVVADDHAAVLWPLLVLTTFLASWTPTAIHFVVGQASFTLFVVVLFNLVDPAGWQTGLVRVEDIAIGVTVAVAVGLVVWPRGVAEQLARLLADAYRAAGHHVEAALTCVVRNAGDDAAERGRASAAIRRADEAVLLVLLEGGSRVHQLDRDDLVTLLVGVGRLRQAGDALGWIRVGRFDITGCEGAVEGLSARAHVERLRTEALADVLTRPAAPSQPGGPGQPGQPSERVPVIEAVQVVGPVPAIGPVPDADLSRADDSLEASVRSAATEPGRGDGRSLVAIVFASRWLRLAGRTTASLAGPARRVGQVGTRPWWR